MTSARELAALAAAFIRRDAAVTISYRAPLLLELFAICFSLALFFYLAELIDESGGPAEAEVGGNYFAYAAIGLALLRILQAGLTSFTIKLRQEQTTGTFEALMATPSSPSAVILCSVVFDFLRALVSAAVLLVVAVILFGLELDTGPAALAVAALALVACVALFAAVGVIVAAFAVVFKQTTALLGMAVTAISLLGGVYFPIELMPEPLQTIAEALPFTWGLDAIRAGLLSDQTELGLAVGVLVAAVVALPLSAVVFRRALNRARRAGTLAQY